LYLGQKEEERDRFCSQFYCAGISNLYDAKGSDGLYSALPSKNSYMAIPKVEARKTNVPIKIEIFWLSLISTIKILHVHNKFFILAIYVEAVSVLGHTLQSCLRN
jgi:hypothetical protein